MFAAKLRVAVVCMFVSNGADCTYSAEPALFKNAPTRISRTAPKSLPATVIRLAPALCVMEVIAAVTPVTVGLPFTHKVVLFGET